MLPYLSKSSRKRASSGAIFIGLIVCFSLIVAACGSPSTGSSVTPTPPKQSITAPTDLVTPGTLTVGSDTTYPPQEFVDTSTGKPIGFDIDLITNLAQRMGLKVDVKKANFTTIIDDLAAKRYDVAISAITINDARKQKADFVPYFNAGESLLVQKGNPENLKTTDDLCGKTVGVQDGTAELDDLNVATKKCTDGGKPAIKMTVLKDQTDVIQLLVNHRVVTTYQDSPVTDYYLKQNPGQFELAGAIVNIAPEGIAIRKGNTAMQTAIQDAFNAAKSDGTYDKLFTTWGLNPVQKLSMATDRKLTYA